MCANEAESEVIGAGNTDTLGSEHTRSHVVRDALSEPPEELELGASGTHVFSGEEQGQVLVRHVSQRVVPCMTLTTRIFFKMLFLGSMAMAFLAALFYWPYNLIEDDDLERHVLSFLFVCGLILVAIEDLVGINKSAIMLVLAATMWTFHGVSFHPTSSHEGYQELHLHLAQGLVDVGSIVLFLLPAMGLVESMDHFESFAVVTRFIEIQTTGHRDRLMPIICLLTFFLSSVIDNLTATIVALKILRHVAPHDKDWRHTCGGLVVIAANAGGAWSPIGDVTTTMLWIQNKISVGPTVLSLFLPSFVAGTIPLAGLWWQANQHLKAAKHVVEDNASSGENTHDEDLDVISIEGSDEISRMKIAALVLGMVCILTVPILKTLTGLPPYLGMLLALGLYWIVTDLVDFKQSGALNEAHSGGVVEALHKVDLTGLFFFTGVLLSVVALAVTGVLERYAVLMNDFCGGNPVTLSVLLGISSAVVDNVPLVQAAIEMFDETPADDPLWQLVALAAGTGGSILSVGSIAGVTLMGMEGVGFLWYLRRISFWAALGFFLGIGTYQLQRGLQSVM